MIALDRTIPAIPTEIIKLTEESGLSLDAQRCVTLWDDVVAEYIDPDFKTRAHHNTGTYDKGCRGPLCTKALRENAARSKALSKVLNLNEERAYDPVMDFFHTIVKYRIRAAQQKILNDLRELKGII